MVLPLMHKDRNLWIIEIHPTCHFRLTEPLFWMIQRQLLLELLWATRRHGAACFTAETEHLRFDPAKAGASRRVHTARNP